MTIVEVHESNLGEDSLLGEPAGDLRLKVSWDSGRTGEVIEVGTQKATIGSNASSTVRLGGADVAPLECLLLRGAARSVVRWYDSAAAASGNDAFEDELLTVGDQLRIGEAELDILSDAGASTHKSPAMLGADVAGYATRLESLERQIADLQRQADADARATTASERELQSASKQQAELTEQLGRVQQLRTDDRERWNAERQELEQLLAVRSADVTDLRAEIETLQADLRSIRAEQAVLRPAAAEQAQRLAAATRKLHEREQGNSEHEQAWKLERQDLETQLEENQQQLAAFGNELSEMRRQTDDLQTTYADAQVQIQDLNNTIQELTSQLEEKETEFAATRHDWERECEQIQQQLDEITTPASEAPAVASADGEPPAAGECERQSLGQQNELSDEQLSRTEEDQPEQLTAPEAPPEDLHLHVDQLGARQFNAAEPSDGAAEPGGLTNTSEGVGLDDAALEASPSPHDDWAGATSPMDRFLSASSLIDDEDRIALGTSDFGSDFSVSAETYEETKAHLPEAAPSADYGRGTQHNEAGPMSTDLVGDYGSPPPHDETPQDSPRRQPSADPPVSTADVLARLGKSDLYSDDVEAESETSSLATDGRDSFYSDRSQEPAGSADFHASVETNTPSLGNAVNAPQGSGEPDEDESIEDYMTRLLNRARGGDDEVRATPAAEVVPAGPVAEYDEATESPTVVPAESVPAIDVNDYKPSRQAPEANVNLDAMRDLANETRRTAIASHAKRNWSSVMKLKLAVSIFAALAVTASVIFFWGDPVVMMCGVAAGLATLGYWGCLARTYRKLLIESLMLDGSSPTPEEAV